MAVQLHAQIRERGRVRLFKSDNPNYADGEQVRDFVWVGDCVDAILWALSHPTATSGLYNVGSGVARSFLDQARIMFHELNVEPKVDFIDMPEALRGKYQYYTCAEMNKLHAVGFDKPVTTLEEGLRTYVSDFLEAEDRYR